VVKFCSDLLLRWIEQSAVLELGTVLHIEEEIHTQLPASFFLKYDNVLRFPWTEQSSVDEFVGSGRTGAA